MTNPLLSEQYLPPFRNVKAEHVVEALQGVLATAAEKINQLESLNTTVTWENFAAVLEDIDEQIDRVWSTVSHLNSVQDSTELREAYQAGLQQLTEFHTNLGQNLQLFNGYKTLRNSSDFADLSTAQKKIINNALRDFRLSGAELNGEDKARYKAIALELSTLSNQFSQNVLDATQSWHLLIKDQAQLAGLPDDAIELAAQTARQYDQYDEKNNSGWRFGLDMPSYIAIMQYADDANIRESLYEAYATRASELGPNAKQFDNSPLIEQIIKLKQEKAELLGYKTYAELALATKMADSATQVIDFINELSQHAKPKAEQELAELTQFANEQYGVEQLQPWDLAYYSEKQKQDAFSFNAEEVKQYFPADTVIQGLFDVANRLFGISVKANPTIETWHDDVLPFDVLDKNQQVIGQLFADLYVRSNKRGGAWMGVCRHRRQTQQAQQLPVAYLTCNFAPATGNKPALLSHDEVETLFHEFGHTLHHLLTQVDEMSVAGINGVAWDAVELPSQFLENWCWHSSSIALISQHYATGAALPQSLLEKMLRAKHFQSGMQTVRQLEFALFDMQIHNGFNPNSEQTVQTILDDVRKQLAVIQPPKYHRFQNSFSHIFAGGYAAGYYSYKWSEVLSADAFSRFEEEGIFNAETGLSFLSNILSQGGAEEPKVLFEKFRGRPPSIEPLLQSSGLI